MDKSAHCVSNPGRASQVHAVTAADATPTHRTLGRVGYGVHATYRPNDCLPQIANSRAHKMYSKEYRERMPRSDFGGPSRRTTEHRQPSVTNPQVVCQQGCALESRRLHPSSEASSRAGGGLSASSTAARRATQRSEGPWGRQASQCLQSHRSRRPAPGGWVWMDRSPSRSRPGCRSGWER